MNRDIEYKFWVCVWVYCAITAFAWITGDKEGPGFWKGFAFILWPGVPILIGIIGSVDSFIGDIRYKKAIKNAQNDSK